MKEKLQKVEENKSTVNYEEVLDTEIDDIWDIFFPYMSEKKETIKKLEDTEKTKPRRYMKFLSI